MLNNPIIMGTKLPSLTNPGTAADLLSGKQLIDGDGNVVTGTLVPGADATATALDILSGKTAYVASGKVTGIRPAKYCAFVSVFFATTGGDYLMVYQNERNITVSLSKNPSGLTTFGVMFGDGAPYIGPDDESIASLSVGISGSEGARTVIITPHAVGTTDLRLRIQGRNGYGTSDWFTYHITVTA